MPREHSMIEQLKAQLQHDRNIADDDTINAMPDSGNVDAFARKLVSAAEPTNFSLKVRDGSFGSEPADGVVSVVSEDEDEFGGNENNRRVAERVRGEMSNRGKAANKVARQRAKAQSEADDDVIGTQREMDREANANNAAVDFSQAPSLTAAGGVLGHSEDGQVQTAGMQGVAFQAAPEASPEPATKTAQDEAAKGGRPSRGWKPQA